MRTLALAALALVGCDAAAAPPTIADKIRAARDRMHQRYDAARRMQLAIALGSLDRAHEEARIVDALEEPDALPEWRVYIDNIRGKAREVVATKDTMAAARMSALMGRECAKCHEAIKARVVFAKDPAPASDPRLAVQMASHEWAAARMWEGIIAPSDERWLQGARTLAAAPLQVVAEDGSLGIANDIARIRLLARRALTPQSQFDRAQLYGDLLATCARCHHTIRD